MGAESNPGGQPPDKPKPPDKLRTYSTVTSSSPTAQERSKSVAKQQSFAAICATPPSDDDRGSVKLGERLVFKLLTLEVITRVILLCQCLSYAFDSKDQKLW